MGGDFNHDVCSANVRHMFQKYDMHEAILQAHQNPPSTFSRNYNRIPIDGLFISNHIQIINVGYTSFSETNWSDH